MSDAAMLLGQVRYVNREFWRTPVSAFFTIVFPLSFLVILSAIYGNAVVDPATGLRLAQYMTPVFAVFGVCMACFMSLAISVAFARASGVLKRLRGTPLPPGMHIAGRIGSAMWVSLIATSVIVGTGVALYDVQIIWENVPALVLTFILGAGCFSALGLAVAAAAPTPGAAQAIGNTAIILLSFISGIFGFGALPTWMDRLASFFPLKHFVDPVSAGFDPHVDASTPSWPDLAMLVAWGIAGALLTWRAFRWEPTPGRVLIRGRRRKESSEELSEELASEDVAPEQVARKDVAAEALREVTVPRGQVVLARAVAEPGPPSLGSVIAVQTRYATRQILRDPMSSFFAIAFPVLLVTFFSLVYGDEATWAGLPLPQYLSAAFATYGVATSGFVNLPGSIADQRTRGVLKRIRGTPQPPWAYLAGRVLAALALGLATVVLVFGVSVTFFSVTLPPSTWAPTLMTFVVSIGCFAACGLALVAVLDGPQAVIAAALGVLLPLSFVSDIFIYIEALPPVLNAIAWVFPLRHAVHAAVVSTSGAQLDAAFWGHLGVVALWMAFGGLLAWRFFHWEPRRQA
ncbi:MAG: ABC transporter permease [Candidatus Nanopelagicales bacterium]